MVMVAKSSLYSNSISSYGMSFFPFSFSAKCYFLTYTTHTSFTSPSTILQVTERPQPEQVGIQGDLKVPFATRRTQFEAMMSRTALPSDVEIKEIEAAGVSCEWVSISSGASQQSREV